MKNPTEKPTAEKEPTLIRHTVARRLALAACKEFGIKATRVSREWIKEVEAVCIRYVGQQAVSSVDDAAKTVRGGKRGGVAIPEL